MAEKVERLVIDEELTRFDALEKEVNDTLTMIQSIIDIYNVKVEIAKGSVGKLVLLFEQKISLLTRKESIIKNMADMKKNMFNANQKVKSTEDGDTDLARVFMEYTDVIKKQQKDLIEKASETLKIVENKEAVDNYFNENKA